MRIFTSRGASALAVAAALSMMATPAMARGWGGGWGNYRHHHRDRVDAGDIFAGLLIIGGIAAIASAASKSQKEKRERDYRYPDRDYRDDSPNYRDDRDSRHDRPVGPRSAGEIGEAVDRCVSEVERGDRRVEQVDNATRSGEGWRIDGQVSGGRDFTCTLDGDLRIRQVTVDGRAA